jgi:hypothetical protein
VGAKTFGWDALEKHGFSVRYAENKQEKTLKNYAIRARD